MRCQTSSEWGEERVKGIFLWSAWVSAVFCWLKCELLLCAVIICTPLPFPGSYSAIWISNVLLEIISMDLIMGVNHVFLNKLLSFKNPLFFTCESLHGVSLVLGCWFVSFFPSLSVCLCLSPLHLACGWKYSSWQWACGVDCGMVVC